MAWGKSFFLILALAVFGCGGGGANGDGDTQTDGDTVSDGDTSVDGDTVVDGDTYIDGDTTTDGDVPDGDASLDIVILSFKADPSWGDAPFATTLSWSLSAPSPSVLICTIDINADGTPEYTIDPCPLEGSQPHTFIDPGRYSPIIQVQNSWGRTSERSIEVFSNMVEYKEHTKFPNQLSGFLSSTVTETAVTLEFSAGSPLPSFSAGDILMGRDGYGYLRKVVAVNANGNRLVITTEQAKLEEAIKTAKYGVKDVLLEFRSVECVENCDSADIIRTPGLKGLDGDFTQSITLAIKGGNLAEGFVLGEAELKIGTRLSYYLDISWTGLNEFSLDIGPFAEFSAEIGITKEFEHTLALPRIRLGVVPIGPLVFTIGTQVGIDFEASVGLVAGLDVGMGVALGASIAYTNGDTEANTDVEVTPRLVLAPDYDPLAGIEGNFKVALHPSIDVRLYDVAGPEIATGPYINIDANADFLDEEVCIEASVGAEVELSVKFDIFITQMEASATFNLIEQEFYDQCFPWSGTDGDTTDGDTQDGDIVIDGDAVDSDQCDPVSHASHHCDQGDVFWYDGCGDREEKKEECDNCTCTGNVCEVNDQSSLQCYDNDVYWYDCHGVRAAKNEECGAEGCLGGVCSDPSLVASYDFTGGVPADWTLVHTNNWASSSIGWSLHDGILEIHGGISNGGGGGSAVYRGDPVADISLGADIQTPAGPYSAGGTLSWTPAGCQNAVGVANNMVYNWGLIVRFNPSYRTGYGLHIVPLVGGGVCALLSRLDGYIAGPNYSIQTIHTILSSMVLNELDYRSINRFTLQAIGSSIIGSINAYSPMSATDSMYSTGNYALHNFDGKTYFDNVKVLDCSFGRCP